MLERRLLITLLATVTAAWCREFALANYSASFKEVAEMGGAIVLARCSSGPQDTVACIVVESWRGKAPKTSIVVARDEWGAYPIGGMEKEPGVKFLLILDAQNQVTCMFNPPFRGMKFQILGDRATCVVPIVGDELPKEFRCSYDHTHGPALALGNMKA